MPKAAMQKAPTTKRTKKTPAKRSISKAAKRAPVPEEVEAPVPEEVEAPPPSPVKARRAPTRESVLSSMDDIVENIESEIQNLRDGPTKTKGIKFLRSVNKRIKILRGQTARVMRQKQKTGRSNNRNSGFLKPVRISDEMARFTNWDPKELRSRVQVTKYICDYIKEHDLQNPADRRQIKPDVKLQKLLGYNPKKNKDPLRYYSLQTYMKPHFPKDE